MNAAQATPDTYDGMLRQSLRCLLKEGKSWLLNDDALEFVVDALMEYEKAMSLQLTGISRDDPKTPAAVPSPTDDAPPSTAPSASCVYSRHCAAIP